jgi:hypothetical protein
LIQEQDYEVYQNENLDGCKPLLKDILGLTFFLRPVSYQPGVLPSPTPMHRKAALPSISSHVLDRFSAKVPQDYRSWRCH